MAEPVRAVVIGGGAAGLMAAGTAAEHGAEVVLLEKNARCAKKLCITGKGRCNVTNCCAPDELLAHIPKNPRFLYSAFDHFASADAMRFFESRGVPLKVERGNRVFPVSDRAADIAAALEDYAKQAGVRICTATAKRLLIADGAVRGVGCADGGQVLADAVVVATGGRSYPQTGSTGDGYRLAAQTGHTVTPQKPSLIPVVTEQDWCRDLMGLSLRNVTLSVFLDQKTLFSDLGELLFTHFGVSGPLVLRASARMKDYPASRLRMAIDLKPGLTEQQLDARLLRDFGKYSNRDCVNALGDLLPRTLIPVMLRLSEIPFTEKVHQLSREQRRTLVYNIKHLPLTVRGYRPIEEAIVTSGGVDVREISPKTMESRLVRGLYFAGEVLDVDGYTGGFNLQIAFSTGYTAGLHLSDGRQTT